MTQLPRLALPGTVWVAADVHLQASQPATAQAFLAFLEAAASEADTLLIPGDLFDAWIGDDILDAPPPALAMVVAALAQVGQRLPLWIGHGNRDFLMGERLMQATNARMLPEQVILDTDAGAWLLMHGDELCTDDVPYQQMRATVRSAAWQAQILSMTIAQRMAIAGELRGESESAKRDKDNAIMDVNEAAVLAAMRDAGVTRLLHGHTHRPARHVFLDDGRRCERWVLPDWHYEGPGPERGGWISLDQDGPALNDWASE